MDVSRLEATATGRAGRDDFGDPSYRQGLEVLVQSIAAEAALSEIGAVAVEAQIVTALVNRLRVVDWRHRHPEVARERIVAPLVILGMPRTGTTLLSALLACDPARRALRRWEATDPIPPPDATGLERDPRIEAAAVASSFLDALNPGFKAIHHEAPEGPTECVTLLAQHFTSLLWETLANVPTYGAWLLQADQRPAYAYHHDVLQVLQSRAPGRWSLKSPHHGLALDALFAQYPDARVVVTHRDPVTVVASLCSLVPSLSGTFSSADHTASIARRWPEVAETIVTRLMQHRDRSGDGPFFDVQYEDLVADPIAVVRSISTWDGTPLSPTEEAAMRAHLVAHPQGAFGRHRYSLDDFGLDAGEVRERFAAYCDRFGIMPEPNPR